MPVFKNNKNLVKHLISIGVLKSERIKEAFLNVDRKDFVPEEFKDDAYANVALPIALRTNYFPTLYCGFYAGVITDKGEG